MGDQDRSDRVDLERGALPVTYERFMQYGIDRHAIGELVALGFLEVTR